MKFQTRSVVGGENEHFALGRRSARASGTWEALSWEHLASRRVASPAHVEEPCDFASRFLGEATSGGVIEDIRTLSISKTNTTGTSLGVGRACSLRGHM